jgi:hypothetical protein
MNALPAVELLAKNTDPNSLAIVELPIVALPAALHYLQGFYGDLVAMS